MTPSPFTVYDAVVSLAGSDTNDALTTRLRGEFLARTGSFTSDDPWFERRSRAFWDDALTRGGLGQHFASSLAPAEAKVARTFARAHRGLFEVRPESGTRVGFRDLWSSAVFWVDAFDPSMNAGIFHHEGGLADARLVANDEGSVAVLPGAFFHPDDATPSIGLVLDEARARGMTTDQTLDALLSMEMRFSTLSRVKASYAYRLGSEVKTRGA